VIGWETIMVDGRSATFVAASGPSAGAAPSRERPGWLLLGLAVLLYCLVGTPLFEQMGVRYTSPENSLLERFHPGSYAVLLLLLTTAATSHGAGSLLRAARRAWPAAGLAAISLLYALALKLIPGNAGLAYLIDTFTAPAVLALLLTRISPGKQALLFRIALACVTLNAVIAIGEGLVRSPLIGAPYGGDHFRATALLGHPLNNALVTAPAVLLTVASPGGTVSRVLRILLLFGALLAFGGRAALVLTLFMVFLGFEMEILRAAVSGQMHRRMLIYGALFVLAPVCLVLIRLTTSIGDRVVDLLYYDESANARFAVFEIFSDVPTEQLWFGSNTQLIADLVARQADIVGIENYWIYLLLQFGIVMFVPFALVFLLFLRWLARGGGLYVGLAVLDFLIISSGNNSLSSKTTALGVLVILAIGAKAQHALALAR
jgi:hypothetical protein